MIDLKPAINNVMTDERQMWFEQLYEDVFPLVAKFVAKRGGSFEDAKDIFHDSLVILYEKTRDARLPAGIAEDRYLVGIAKHLWLRKFREDHKMIRLDDMEKSISLPEDYFDSSDNRLVGLLELTGRRCMELLRAFYYDNLGIREITNVFGFSSDHSASVQKFKCIEKIRDTVQKKSLSYEDFA
jgi:DNA-directed RNA polymerase specialized sigma24 family protein